MGEDRAARRSLLSLLEEPLRRSRSALELAASKALDRLSFPSQLVLQGFQTPAEIDCSSWGRARLANVRYRRGRVGGESLDVATSQLLDDAAENDMLTFDGVVESHDLLYHLPHHLSPLVFPLHPGRYELVGIVGRRRRLGGDGRGGHVMGDVTKDLNGFRRVSAAAPQTEHGDVRRGRIAIVAYRRLG